jgi:N6-adenosine-specific RNA methylase IME4
VEKFSTIVGDPPWQVKTGPMSAGGMGLGFKGGSRQSQPLKYPTMTVDEICALPVGEMAAPDAHLYLWTVNRYLEDAFRVARVWGFDYSTTCVWSKKLMGGGLGGTFRITTEFFLFCRRGRLEATRTVPGTCFDWKRVLGPPVKKGEKREGCHSAKPPEFMDLVEEVSPGPYVELFSREKAPRLGWSYWGNESLGTAEMPDLLAA